MIKKIPLASRNIFTFVRSLIGFALLLIFAFFLNALFASHGAQTASGGPQQLPSLSLIPTSTSVFSQTPPRATPQHVQPEWNNYSEADHGFSIRYPSTWYQKDLSKSPSFQNQCFGTEPAELSHEGQSTDVQFCIELNPWVRPLNLNGFASNKSAAQQDFFDELLRVRIGQPLVIGTNQYIISQHYRLAGATAIERIETDAPGTEGYEPSYVVAVYVNDPKRGLIRLYMRAMTLKQFEENENIFRQMLESFSLLK